MKDPIDDFLDKVFGDDDEQNPCVLRNPDCDFTEKVLEYIFFEWEADVIHYDHGIQNKVMDVIESMKGKDNVPNTAAKIAMEVLPI